MTALFDALVASLVVSFTANTLAKSNVLTSPSSLEGLFLGLPVVGGSIPKGALITSLDPLTISEPAGGNGNAVSLSTGFLTTGRRFKHWSEVPDQPALFLRAKKEELEYPSTVFQQQTIRAEAWIYSNDGKDPDVVPETLLNNLLDAVQAAMAPDNRSTNTFTLGGLVYWCRLSGEIEKDSGDVDGQAIAVADIEIIVP
jgi:hypothetical protein